jgi:acetylornithine deacetylase/succinyl-diaminopimelate desuccinylase-like protein
MFQPALNIAGLNSGYLGEGPKTVLPARAMAKVDLRLVPNQDPEDIFAKFTKHVAVHAPRVRVRQLGPGRPALRSSSETPASQAVIRAVRHSWHAEPVIVPSMGASMPVDSFAKTLGIPMVWVPYGEPDERAHAPNENMNLAAFWRGVRTGAAVFAELAKLAE